MLKTSFLRSIFPVKLKAQIRFWKGAYLSKTGWIESFKIRQPIDADREPLPWYTYPAIEYVKQLDFSEREVFEYGSGNSTIFWSKLAQRVVSIENNQKWYETVQKKVQSNVEVKLIENDVSYIQEISNHNSFDVIVIDGVHRFECAKASIDKLKPGGMIILDNSDWHVKTAKLLRSSNLIQVDMTGLGPINSYTWTTSFFLNRDFNFQPKGVEQPKHGIGALKLYAEE